MRLLLLLTFALSASLFSAEPYPLWDGKESVADYAKHVNLPPTQTLDLGNGVKLDLVLIPAGRFITGTPPPTPIDFAAFQDKIVTGQALLAVSTVALMVMLTVVLIRAIRQKRRPQVSLGRLLLMTIAASGCVLSGLHWKHSILALEKAKFEYDAAQSRYFNLPLLSEKPAHQVTLTQPFYMSKCEVTQGQYQAVIGANPSTYKGSNNPVDMVSWNDAQAFCKKVSEQTKQTIQLPTEAEWEYACRAGTTTAFHSGDTEADLDRVAWYEGNSEKMTQPVGQKEANAFGLYDMHGNVLESCVDLYDGPELIGPSGRDSVTYRVIKGGSFQLKPRDSRSAVRSCVPPDLYFSSLGFRVVMRVAGGP
jgi:formylglycine-generating enzyme required for sulfatase activity